MLRTGKTAAIIAGSSSFCGTSQAAFAKLADPAGGPNWSDTSPSGFGQVCRALLGVRENIASQTSPYALPSKNQKIGFALARLAGH
jgi:hypothetical protein